MIDRPDELLAKLQILAEMKGVSVDRIVRELIRKKRRR